MANSELRDHYRQLNKYLQPIFHVDVTPDNFYQIHLIAAFSKCFEFNLLVNRRSSLENSFFYTPALRGICEDIIALRFLKRTTIIDKNEILKHYPMFQLASMIETQAKFFSKNHKQQIVFDLPERENTKLFHLNSLRDEWIKLNKKKSRDDIKPFPSVSQMAVDGGLTELYDYLYSATSDMVHFSPHNLMRSGWSKEKDGTSTYFSNRNFSKYYSHFNEFYGSYLFIKFITLFKKEINAPKEAKELFKKIEEVLSFNARWPEMVTFEEMNVPEAASIRLINAVRKLKNIAKEEGISDEDAEEMIKEYLKREKQKSSK